MSCFPVLTLSSVKKEVEALPKWVLPQRPDIQGGGGLNGFWVPILHAYLHVQLERKRASAQVALLQESFFFPARLGNLHHTFRRRVRTSNSLESLHFLLCLVIKPKMPAPWLKISKTVTPSWAHPQATDHRNQAKLLSGSATKEPAWTRGSFRGTCAQVSLELARRSSTMD